jgi:hypothetical protein
MTAVRFVVVFGPGASSAASALGASGGIDESSPPHAAVNKRLETIRARTRRHLGRSASPCGEL